MRLIGAAALVAVVYFVGSTVFQGSEDTWIVPDRATVREADRTWNGPDPADGWEIGCYRSGAVAQVEPGYEVMVAYAEHVCEHAARAS